MNDNFSEKDMKDTFHKYHPDLNTDEIWENIEPKLKKKKKRRFFFWLWFGAVGGLLFLLGKMWLPTPTPSETVQATTEVDKTEEAIIESTYTEAISFPEVNLEKEVVKPNTVVNRNSNSNKSNSHSITTELIAFDQTIEERNANFMHQKSSTYTSTDNNVITSQVTVSLNKNNHSSSKIETSTYIVEENTIATKNESTINDSIENTNEENAVVLIDKIETTGKQKKEIKNIDNNVNEKAHKKKKKKKKKVVRKKKKNWFTEAQITGSYILPIRSLSANPNAPTFDYSILGRRIADEKQREGFGGKLGIDFQHRKGLIISTGLEYQQLNEVLKSNFEETKFVSQEVVVSVVEDRDGNIISSTTEQMLVQQTTTKIQRIYNKYRFFNIPIGMGIAWTKKKHHYKVLGGIDVSALLFKGQTSGATAFNSASFNLWVAGEYHKPINNRLSIVVSPKLQLPITPITSELSGITQSYTKLNMEAGINYWLNPKKFKRKRRKF